jgi:hypothetical protein
VTLEAGSQFPGVNAVDASFTDCTGLAWTLQFTGRGSGENRPKITGWNTGTGNGLGVTSNGGTTLIAENLISENNVDGFSLHGSLAHGRLTDVELRNNSKSAGAHVETGGTLSCLRVVHRGASGGSAILIETTPNSANHEYVDCDFIPFASGAGCTFLQSRVKRSRVGTMTLRVATQGGVITFGNTNGPTMIEDSFLHVLADQNAPFNWTRCYGFPALRQRNMTPTYVASVIDQCIFGGGPIGGTDSLLWNGFNPGAVAAQISIRNSVLFGFNTAIGESFDTVARDYFRNSLPAASTIDHNCFNGNVVDIDSDLTGLGAPWVQNNVFVNPLVGPCDTTDQARWALQASSPCRGAGIGGVDIGFRA